MEGKTLAKIALIAGIAAVGIVTGGLGLLPASIFGVAISNGGVVAGLLAGGLGASDPDAPRNLMFPERQSDV